MTTFLAESVRFHADAPLCCRTLTPDTPEVVSGYSGCARSLGKSLLPIGDSYKRLLMV